MQVLGILIVVLLGYSDGYKVLVVFPMPGKSHSILGEGFVDTLAQAGHEVTIITPFPKEKVPSNVHQVSVSGIINAMPVDKQMNIAYLAKNPFGMLMMAVFGAGMPKLIGADPNLQTFLSDNTQQFDVVIAEWFFTPLLAGFAAVYQCPLIWVSSMDPHASVLQLIDEASSPAYSASVMSKTAPPFGFGQRVVELWIQIYMSIIQFFINVFIEKPAYQEFYGPAAQQRGHTLPDLNDVAHNASLMFFNAQPELGTPFRLPQSGKYIGGYHIDPRTKPLPENLQKLFDNSKDGVIYFSMGSNLKSKDIPDNIKYGLVKMFGQLKQTVLWKFEEELPNLPQNLHIVDWAPQPSILYHPNTRIFITHGGKLSTTEAIHYGIPIIGIPIFGDQFVNMHLAVEKGYALTETFDDDLADNLGAAIREMLQNPSYQKVAKELSTIYHDRPLSPRQELVHWVEHVIRTGGARHLRSTALDTPCYQKMYLDLIAVLLVASYVSCKIIKYVCCSKKTVLKDKKIN